MIKICIRFKYLIGCISRYPDNLRIILIWGGIIILRWVRMVPLNLIYWTNVTMHLPDNCWSLVKSFLFCHQDFDFLDKLHQRYIHFNKVLDYTHIDEKYAVDFQSYKGRDNLQSIYSIKKNIKHFIDYYYEYKRFPAVKCPSV